MLSRSIFARYLLVAVVSDFVATATATTAVTEVSAVDSNFFRVVAYNLDNMPAKEEPKPEVRSLRPRQGMGRDAEPRERRVRRRDRAEGLSLDEFKAKFAAKLGRVAKKDQMTEKMKACLELRASLNGKSTDELADLVEKVNDVCGKALLPLVSDDSGRAASRDSSLIHRLSSRRTRRASRGVDPDAICAWAASASP